MNKLLELKKNEITETNEVIETENLETPVRPSSPIYEFPKIPKGYVMDDTTRDFLACNDRDDLKKLLCKLKEKSLNARMKYVISLLLHLSLLLIRIMNSLSIQS